MKFSLALIASLIAGTTASGIIDQAAVKNMHKEWMVEHGKHYATPAEEDHRFGVFMQNLEKILQHNIRHTMGETGFTMEMNSHGDMTFDEWKGLLTYSNDGTHEVSKHLSGTHRAPLIRGVEADSVDWRAKGAVTPVKDQGQCGSCWSFSATGAMEGAHFLATGELVSLSEEQLLNCVHNGETNCNTGGLMDWAFDFVISNKGIVDDATDPYNIGGIDGQCKYHSGDGTKYAATFSSFKDVTANDENALKSAVAQQPVSVAIDASHQSFQFYSSGVYDEPACCTNCQLSQLDHGVLVAGYGTEDGKDYWLVKNSWASGWGDQGYIKIIRNDSGRCGVPAVASYPVV